MKAKRHLRWFMKKLSTIFFIFMFQTLLFSIFIVQAKAGDHAFLMQTDIDNTNIVSNNKYNRISTTYKLLNIDHSFTFGTYETEPDDFGGSFFTLNKDGTGIFGETTDTGGDPSPIAGFVDENRILFKYIPGNYDIMTAKIINQNTIVIHNRKYFLRSTEYVDVRKFFNYTYY
jgi:hypothetical protein